jgi:uncharacterized protein (DUF1499 family)
MSDMRAILRCYGLRMTAADLPPPPAVRRLARCPDRPNCVSSLAEDAVHRVEPLPLDGKPEQALKRLGEIIEAMPGATLGEVADGHLEARFRSRLFRFTDDLEMVVDAQAGVIHIRSASRVGYSDLGVNRRRVEAIRSRYRSRQTQAHSAAAAKSSARPRGQGPRIR